MTSHRNRVTHAFASHRNLVLVEDTCHGKELHTHDRTAKAGVIGNDKACVRRKDLGAQQDPEFALVRCVFKHVMCRGAGGHKKTITLPRNPTYLI